MRVGDDVCYHNGRAGVQAARVVAVTGAGPSGYKTLDLDVGGQIATDVPHAHDFDGEDCWCLADEVFDFSPPAPPIADDDPAWVSPFSDPQ